MQLPQGTPARGRNIDIVPLPSRRQYRTLRPLKTCKIEQVFLFT